MAVTSSGWDASQCRGGPDCPPRCPRFVDADGRPLLVRPVEDDDGDRTALLDLYDCGPEGHSASYPPYRRRAALAPWLDGLLARGRNLVAMAGDRPIGHAVTMPMAAGEREFAVFVAPDERGRGIASELLRQAIRWDAAAGTRALVMQVQATNHPMLTIAHRHGFEAVTQPSAADRFTLLSLRLPLQDSPAVDRLALVSARDGPPADESDREDGLRSAGSFR